MISDELQITTWLQEMRGTRATRHYEMRRQGEADLLVTAEALWVWVERTTIRPRPIPEVLVQDFQAQIAIA
ncbi:MAG TPA: acyl-ACP thioesterase domain-containing protein [Candidatus Obscuribacterales bacterium]